MQIFKNKLFIVTLVIVIVSAICVTVLVWPERSPTGFFNFKYNERTYKLYIPSSYGIKSMPMMVVLHGCTQSADKIAKQTSMNSLAEREGFIVLYPEQTEDANSAVCWNFFMPENQSRGVGEPAEIVGMVEEVKANYHIDDDKVFVTGLSAGGAMTSILGATYPDVFRAIAVCSGLTYKTATSVQDAGMAMIGLGRNPIDCGADIYTAMGENARVMPTLIFHGRKDELVYVTNAEHLTVSWAVANDYADDGEQNNSIDTEADVKNKHSETSETYTEYIYNDSEGNPVIYKYLVDEMKHTWLHFSPLNQSQIIWDFFKSVS